MESVTKQKRNKWFWSSLITLGIITLSNLPGPSDLFEMWVDHNHYRYSNGDGTWTGTENLFKKEQFHFIRKITWPEFFARYPGADSTVYRVFTKHPLAFWRYGKYFFDRRYTLPYKNWDEIKA